MLVRILSDCRQWVSRRLAALECTIVFSRGSAPETAGGAHSSLNPLSGLRGTYF